MWTSKNLTHFKYREEDSLDMRATPPQEPGSYQVDLSDGDATSAHHNITIIVSICFSLFIIFITTIDIGHNTIIPCLNVLSLVHRIQRIAQESDEASF